VSELISASYPERDVLAEAERCVVLCANCHRKTHG
jgi:L-lysine 2,3-aminomutase